MIFSKGEILLVTMVFTDGSGTKKRPVLVVFDSGDDDLLVAPVTSQPIRSDRDIALNQWQQSGLRLPSIIRLEKLATVHKSTVQRRLGRIKADDWNNVKNVLKNFFGNILA